MCRFQSFESKNTDNGIGCGTTIQVPLHLVNGAWTLQWAYYGGYFNAGDYYACVDYNIVGGPTDSQQAPTFRGGDATYPNQQVCKYYSTNKIHVCPEEPCTNAPQPGVHVGAAFMSPSPTRMTTAFVATVALTTGTSATELPTKALTTTDDVTKKCYEKGTAHDIPFLNSTRCGTNVYGRCIDNQCCSKYGFCGPVKQMDGNYHEEGQIISEENAFSLYCTNNQGDWRLIPCPSEDGGIISNIVLETSSQSDTDFIDVVVFANSVTCLSAFVSMMLFLSQ